MGLTAEFTVEPFVPGAPGPHVTAAIEASRRPGVTVVVGPFGNEITGQDDDLILAAAFDAVGAGLRAGATRVALELRRT